MNESPTQFVSPVARPSGARWACVAAIALLALVCALALAPRCRAQSARPAEYQVKAVYLYDFGRFVQWPAQATPVEEAGKTASPQSPALPFSICVLGRDPFGRTLESVAAGGSINGQRVTARRIEKIENAADCRILFVSASEDSRLMEILAGLQSAPLLTVSDMPDFCNRGGMIQFVMQDNKVRFEVNLTAAQKAKLSLSSQLLKVATSVRGNPQNGNGK